MTDTTTEPPAIKQPLQQHAQTVNPHHVSVEEVDDVDLARPSSSGGPFGVDGRPSWAEQTPERPSEQPETQPPSRLDTQSHEIFPELGGPKLKQSSGVAPIWGAKLNTNGSPNGSGIINGSLSIAPAVSCISKPTGPKLHGPPSGSIAGRNVETMFLEPQHVLPRNQLKRPLPDIIKDLNRRSRAIITMSAMPNGKLKFEATGPQEAAVQSLKELVQHIGTKQSIKVTIPSSARAHIIGKGGSTIKTIQEKTGARLQLPKLDESRNPVDEDDDGLIDVIIEGNAFSAASARDRILKIAGERAASVNTKVRGIPVEFYPFIAGPKNSFVSSLEENNGVQVRVPPHQAWSSQPPRMSAAGEQPVFAPAPDENYIQLAGERAAVQAARAEIERRAEDLRRQLVVEQFSIQRGRHQFIIGDRGVPMNDFYDETGCVIVLPNDEDDDVVTIVGPPKQVPAGLEKAMDLAMNMQCSNIDISRFHRQAPGGAAAHARNVTRYLRQRKEIERLEKLYNVHFNTPFYEGGALPWELYSRDGKNAIKAQSEIKGLVDSHPPARMVSVAVDPFYHQYIRNEVLPRVRQDYGTLLVIPDASEGNTPILLVYEGPSGPEDYQIPRSQPNPSEVEEMSKQLQDVRRHILDLVNRQEALTSQAIDVPQMFHEKLKKFIRKEQERRDPGRIPVRVSNAGTTVMFRGPCSAVENLAAKCEAFVEQEKLDEKERGFTLSFEFPQKFANHLIGKGGSHIRELRERFDVEIQVNDGKVELKGPKAKAEAAKSHILLLGRQLQDETTHVLKIDPKFHRELIGAGGSQITRLQTRYKVLIFFPRTAKTVKEDESVADASDAGKPRRQQGPDEVIIRGPRRGADEARDELWSLMQYLQDNSFTANVTVQQKQLPSLIGSGGAGMDQLRQETGARIDIPGDRDTSEALIDIQIKGTKAQVAAAKKLLEEKKAVFDDTVTRTLDVDKKYHKALIGAGGSNLRDMVVKAGGSTDRRELARTIQFPRQESGGNMIKVEGRTEVVNKIVEYIQAFVSERESQVSEVLDVAPDKHRRLIGRGGDVKRSLESQFKVSIDIPRQGSDQTGVKIVGQSEDIAKAKAHIEALVKDQEGETIPVPRALHHSISNGGQIFRKLRNEYRVTVDHAGQQVPAKPAPPTSSRANGASLPLITDDAEASVNIHSWTVVEPTFTETGEIPWILRGSPENVLKAKQVIETAMEQGRTSKDSAIGYLILPDPRTYRHVIGAGGSRVNSIRKQSGCKITVPREQSGDDAIEIVGSKEGVELAKELVLTAVRDGLSSIRTPRE